MIVILKAIGIFLCDIFIIGLISNIFIILGYEKKQAITIGTYILIIICLIKIIVGITII